MENPKGSLLGVPSAIAGGFVGAELAEASHSAQIFASLAAPWGLSIRENTAGLTLLLAGEQSESCLGKTEGKMSFQESLHQ